MPCRHTSRRWKPATGAFVAALVLTAIIAVSPGAAAIDRGCAGRVSAGLRTGIQLRAFDLRGARISCDRARRVVRAFLDKKLSDRTERCAGWAETPPFRQYGLTVRPA